MPMNKYLLALSLSTPPIAIYFITATVLYYNSILIYPLTLGSLILLLTICAGGSFMICLKIKIKQNKKEVKK